MFTNTFTLPSAVTNIWNLLQKTVQHNITVSTYKTPSRLTVFPVIFLRVFFTGKTGSREGVVYESSFLLSCNEFICVQERHYYINVSGRFIKAAF